MTKAETYQEEAVKRVMVLGNVFGVDYIKATFKDEIERVKRAENNAARLRALKPLVRALDKDLKAKLNVSAPVNVRMGSEVIQLRLPDPEEYARKEIAKLMRRNKGMFDCKP